VDKILSNPEVSDDRRTWRYKGVPGEKMDWAYNARSMLPRKWSAVFCHEKETPGEGKPIVPGIRMISPRVGTWNGWTWK